ncbi:DUF3455 domain-containing protein [Streptomyces sp. NPDC086080]|uniref:DUF3455 domain-containing protein n=1 Tax=Streptomyces sp. NPDC086080 TaxID=3365748 RepID=UPI0037D600A0
MSRGIRARRGKIGAGLIGVAVTAGLSLTVLPQMAHASLGDEEKATEVRAEQARGGDKHRGPGRPGGPRSTGKEIHARVITGSQIYRCAEQDDGSFAYAQDNVTARLARGIKHSFVTPSAGPPQWIARDGSAVTGTVVSRTPNGEGNIPLLELTATQSGESEGLLAGVTRILRLKTVGGVAPAGTCDREANPTASVPYKAEYVFIKE